MSLIELKNLTIGHNGRVAVKDINAAVEVGDFVCIVGPNGAGKSTLIQTILGLIPPIKGKVLFHDMKRNRIGFLAQDNTIDTNFPATVLEIVLSGTLNMGGKKLFYDKSDKEKTEKALKTVGILELKNHSFNNLSGGQRQKVLLARALAATSQVLILDEPTNNLDLKSIKELYHTLTRLNKDGITILMITHDLDHHNLIGNKILSLRDEVFFGETAEFVKKVHNE